MASAVLELAGVRKRYDSLVAVDDLDLALDSGEFLTLLGPSGSGKTTTLMMVAGLQQPDAGSITLNGASVASLPPYRRDIGMVFQNYALFPHMTVRRNVALPARDARHAARPRSRAWSTRRWRWSSCPTMASACRSSSPAASSSAWRSPAPWSTGRRCC